MCTYLTASLPAVALGDPAPWTPDEFLFHCQGALTVDQLRELSLVIEERSEEGTSDFAAWWAALDTQIRNQLARMRAGRLGLDARSFVRMHSGFDVSVEQCVADAMDQPDPLARETALDRCRWKALDEYIKADRFGLSAVLAYGVRMLMLDRWQGLTDEAGSERVEAFLAQNADQSLELQRHGGS
jgi:hypothetical protein